IATSVGDFAAALALARGAGLVASVPERHTAHLRGGLHTFALPLPLAPFTVALLWHPRLESDPAQRWLRACVRDACAGTEADPG
ncbi:MAG: LysR substrate-binding domain-containing protein, partial [Betaproteobacteria bacterium]